MTLCVLAALVLTAAAASARAEPDTNEPELDTFLDEAGEWRPARDAYRSWLSPHHRAASPARAAAEGTLFVLLGTAYYWVDPLANSVDWDFPSFGSKLRFESVRLDNNFFATNHLLHPFAGASVYGFARVNGLGVAPAFGYAVASSAVWEFGLEYREQASINDLVFTPFGGAALGESLFQLGAYLNSAPGSGNLWTRVARVTLGLPQYLHDSLDDGRAPREPPADALGLSSAYWHQFSVAYEHAFVHARDGEERVQGFELTSQIVAMPGFLRPGRFSRAFADGNFSELSWRMAWGKSGLDDVDLWAMADLAGFYQQDVRGVHDARRGTAAKMALSTALRFNQRELAERADRFAIAHLLGPHVGLWFLKGELRGHADFSIHPDFAGVHPLGFEIWEGGRERGGVKTILARHRYYYAFGYSFRARGNLTFGRVGLEAHSSYGAYDSLEGIDRWQDQVTRDVPMRDTVLEYGASFGLRPSGALRLRLEVDELRRSGTMGNDSAALSERRIGSNLGIVF
ncbi:MAG: DUF3943 domain-containing protein [Myxococcota bacterium]|nr:DUF3943 domain-containing protein [Myxococcota bacterium]